MANCNHKKCQQHAVCGEIPGDGKKNPGGNIYSFGFIYKHKTHQLRGWHSGAESRLYNELVSGLNNGTVIEVGVYGGASLLGIIESCQKTNSHIYGIDPWEKVISANGRPLPKDQGTIYKKGLKKIRLNLENIIQCEGYDKNVTLIHDFSKNIVAQFEDESVDVVFIDGDHCYGSVFEDLTLWLPKVKSGGAVWGDDFPWRSVRMAVQDFCVKYKLELQSVCDGRAWKINK